MLQVSIMELVLLGVVFKPFVMISYQFMLQLIESLLEGVKPHKTFHFMHVPVNLNNSKLFSFVYNS